MFDVEYFAIVADSKHVKSTPTIGWLKAFMRGLKYAEFQGDVMQQGASLIVGPGRHDKSQPTNKSLNNYCFACVRVRKAYPRTMQNEQRGEPESSTESLMQEHHARVWSVFAGA